MFNGGDVVKLADGIQLTVKSRRGGVCQCVWKDGGTTFKVEIPAKMLVLVEANPNPRKGTGMADVTGLG